MPVVAVNSSTAIISQQTVEPTGKLGDFATGEGMCGHGPCCLTDGPAEWMNGLAVRRRVEGGGHRPGLG